MVFFFKKNKTLLFSTKVLTRWMSEKMDWYKGIFGMERN
jgi:hypothetical protein